MKPRKRYPTFPTGTVDHVCQLIGDLYTGTELTSIASDIPLRDDPGEGLTKWRRLATAVKSNQTKTGTGNALIALVTEAMKPDRILNRAEAASRTRDKLNQALSLVALRVREDGRVTRTQRATTTDEAFARTEQLRILLQQRGAHQEVIAYCRPELLRDDYYEAVFEGIKGLGSRLRQLTSEDTDGYQLVESTMAGASPVVRVNKLETRTDRDEQLGVANLAKGLFSAFRNPAAHEPRIEWTMSEQDALDVLGTLSMIHRRLDNAKITMQSE